MNVLPSPNLEHIILIIEVIGGEINSLEVNYSILVHFCLKLYVLQCLCCELIAIIIRQK